MASSLVRRPLPALIALFALLLLTALVWWRVLHRNDDDHSAAPSCPTPGPTQSPTHTLPAPGTVTVQVLNGTFKLKHHRNGIAGKVATALGKDGFKVPDPAADDKLVKVRAVAEIRFGPKGKSAATLLDYYFDQRAKLVPTEDRTAVVTVSLGRKYHRLVDKAQVTRALAADHVSLASPHPTESPSGAASCAAPAPRTAASSAA